EIVMAEPSFSEYDFASRIMDAKVVKVPLKDYTHDLKAMAGAVTPRTKIIFVCNPNNPTGTIVVREEVDAWLKALPENILVVFDEAYYEYVDNDRYPRSLEYVRQGKNVVVLRTFSKIYGLAGLRVGYGIANREIVAALNRVRQPFNVNSLAQKAALAALDDREFLANSREVVNEGKKYLYRALEEMGLFYVPSEANFIFIDTGLDCGEVFPRLLQKGVIVRTGDIFNHPTFIRLTVGTMRDNERFIAALKEVLGG
ncbi:MAG TPA: aminotransferase class I/II-fold pyridoxal phosphate-dependent enzyme, partial [Firmicutes bacterium]|nr:aminotransferase class I/II-fold pyridoxal phosphate-dependent enzyme [Bacillota bacterium]